MKKLIILISLIVIVLLVIFALPNNQLEPNEDAYKIEFTFANEASYDTTISAFINGELKYEYELISSKTAGGYFGQEFDVTAIEVPEEPFELQVTESATGFEKTITIDPTEGLFISATYWNNQFVIIQDEFKKIRID